MRARAHARRWRNISPLVQSQTVGANSDDPWYCTWNTERPRASCAEPDDYDTAKHLGMLGQ